MSPILPPFSHSCLTLLSIMLPFNRSWIHQLDRGRVTVRRSSGTITPYLVAQRCRTVLKGGTYGLFCRPKVPCDTQRRHLRGLFVAREHSDKLSREQNAPFRSRDNLGRPFREQNAPFRSRDDLGRPSREQNTPFRSRDASADPSVSRTRRLAHETSSEDPSVSRTRRLAHETTLADPFVSRTRRSAHETTSEDPSVSRMRLFAHETAAKDTRGNRGAFSASYGNSTGAPRCRRGETRASATHRETWCLSGR